MENGEDEFNDIAMYSAPIGLVRVTGLDKNGITYKLREENMKKIVNEIRQDTLRQVLPKKAMSDDSNSVLYACRKGIINKAKELWGIELNNIK